MEPTYTSHAMWHVLQLIENNLTDDGARASLNLYTMLDAPSSAPPPEFQIKALSCLRDEGIVAFDEKEIKTTLHEGNKGPEILVTTYGLTIDAASFSSLYQQYLAWSEDLANQRTINLTYDPADGVGRINDDQKFHLKGANKKTFNLLYANVNQWIAREQILKLLGMKRDANGSYAKLQFNTRITNLRKATGLTKYQLLQSDGQVMLKIK